MEQSNKAFLSWVKIPRIQWVREKHLPWSACVQSMCISCLVLAIASSYLWGCHRPCGCLEPQPGLRLYALCSLTIHGTVSHPCIWQQTELLRDWRAAKGRPLSFPKMLFLKAVAKCLCGQNCPSRRVGGLCRSLRICVFKKIFRWNQ